MNSDTYVSVQVYDMVGFSSSADDIVCDDRGKRRTCDLCNH
jgi:hypothetical protein